MSGRNREKEEGPTGVGPSLLLVIAAGKLILLRKPILLPVNEVELLLRRRRRCALVATAAHVAATLGLHLVELGLLVIGENSANLGV